MDYPKVFFLHTLRLATRLYSLACKLCRTKRRTATLLRAKCEAEMGIQMRDLQRLVRREGDTIRPSDSLWESKGFRGPTRIH